MSNAGHHSSLDIGFMKTLLYNGKIKRYQEYNIFHFEGEINRMTCIIYLLVDKQFDSNVFFYDKAHSNMIWYYDKAE